MSAKAKPSLKNKILWTIGLLVCMRFIDLIQIPGIVYDQYNTIVSSNSITNFFNIITGGSFSRFSVTCLGIIPIVNANIIYTLLSTLSPRLKAFQSDGKNGKDKIKMFTKLLSIAISAFMSIGIVQGLDSSGLLINDSSLVKVLIVMSIMLGTLLINVIVDQITLKGIMEGVNAVILVNTAYSILLGLCNITALVHRNAITFVYLFAVIIVLFGYCAIVYRILKVTYRLPIHIANGKFTKYNFRDLEISFMGFASTAMVFTNMILSIPTLLHFCFSNSKILDILLVNRFSPFNSNGVIHYICYVLLIIGFYMYSTYINYDTKKMSEDFQKNNIIVTGINPGIKTNLFLRKVINKHSIRAGIITALLGLISIIINKVLPNLDILNLQAIIIGISIVKDLSFMFKAELRVKHMNGFLSVVE